MTDLRELVWNELDVLLESREGDTPVLGLAVSGGTDSRALLELMRGYPAEIHVLHVNHGLRPTAGEEALEVAQLASEYGLVFKLYEYGAKDYEDLPATGLEDRARILRYRAFDEWLVCGNRVILLGHHADDQAETILLQMLRGTHVKGLRGMLKVRDRYLRPLLDIRRESLEAYLTMRGIAPIEDESNLELRMTRNRIRHEVMPLLEEVFERDPVTMLVRTAEALEDNTVLVDHLLKTSYNDYLKGEDGIYKALREVPQTVVRSILQHVLPLKDLSRQHYYDMAELLNQQEFKSLDLPHYVFATGWGYYCWGDDASSLRGKLEARVSREYPQVLVEDLPKLQPGTYDHWELKIFPGETKDGPWSFQIEQESYDKLRWQSLEVLENKAYWRKKLKKWGVPAPARERLPLCFLEDELVWVPGYRIERQKAGDVCLIWHSSGLRNNV